MNKEQRIEILTRKLFDLMLETVHLMVAIADEIGASRWKVVMASLWTEFKMARNAAKMLLPQEIVIVDNEELQKQMEETK